MISVKKLLKSLLSTLPGKYILLESAPDLSDNTKAVFNEMIHRGLNKKYKMVWRCWNPVKNYPKIKNVIYLPISTNKIDQWFYSYILIRAKLIITCNRTIMPTNPNTLVVYLHHGTPIKDTRKYAPLSERVNYVLAPSIAAEEIIIKQFNVPHEKVFSLGYPRNDEFALESIDLHRFFPDRIFKKVIVWYPTFRQHIFGRNTGSVHALPVLWDEEKAKRLNEFASNNGVLIVIKPHFAQDISYIKKLNMSNIVFIDDEFFYRNDLSSYRFVGSCDALLTDYSSIYFDYTLCDKPIGLTWEDYDDYLKDPGFIIDMDDTMSGGEKIYSFDDLKAFIKEISLNIDKLQKSRRIIRDRYNYSTDGKNTERVMDYLIEKACL